MKILKVEVENKNEKDKRKLFDILFDDTLIVTSEIVVTSVSNKFDMLINFIEELCDKIEGFELFFKNLVDKYVKNPTMRLDLLKEGFKTIVEAVVKYEEVEPIDYSKFVDINKVKSGSIFFDIDEIKDIMICSNVMKVYSLFHQVKELKLAELNAREVFNDIINMTINMETISKLLDVIKTKAYRCNITDRYMWDYIKQMRCHDTDCQVTHIFNFIMNNILILCERGKNPITFMVTTIDDSILWFLRSVYRDTCRYTDDISTEEINPTNIDNLKAYSYNYSIGQLVDAARNRIVQHIHEQCIKLGMEFDNKIVEFDDRIKDIAKWMSPASEYMIFPILSKSLTIPYEYFKTLSVNHSIQLNIYLKFILERVFDGEMLNLINLLDFFPINKPPVSSTLRIKDMPFFVNNVALNYTVFGYKSSICIHDLIQSFLGKVARNSYMNAFTGQTIGSWPQSPLETDIMFFYLNFFNRNDTYINNKMANITKIILKDI